MNKEKPILVEGKKINLISFSEDFITETYVGWLNDPEMSTIISSAKISTTLEEVRQYCHSLMDSEDNFFFAVITRKEKKHIGNFRLGPLDRVNNRIQLGMMIGDKKYHGQGLGSEIVSLGLKFSFETLSVHKVFLDVREDNIAAIRIYEKNGFIHEGTLKDHLRKNNRFYDLKLMGAINPNN